MERERKWIGAGRKSGKRKRSGERRSQKTMERERSAERGLTERERSGGSRNALRVEHLFWPLTLRSHALRPV